MRTRPYALLFSPIRWDDARHTLTIGTRRGSFPGMLGRRTFNIVWVGPGHGVGVNPPGTVDMTVSCDGTAVNVQR
jgi:alpha-D-xyloside xylohydrolase